MMSDTEDLDSPKDLAVFRSRPSSDKYGNGGSSPNSTGSRMLVTCFIMKGGSSES